MATTTTVSSVQQDHPRAASTTAGAAAAAATEGTAESRGVAVRRTRAGDGGAAARGAGANGGAAAGRATAAPALVRHRPPMRLGPGQSALDTERQPAVYSFVSAQCRFEFPVRFSVVSCKGCGSSFHQSVTPAQRGREGNGRRRAAGLPCIAVRALSRAAFSALSPCRCSRTPWLLKSHWHRS